MTKNNTHVTNLQRNDYLQLTACLRNARCCESGIDIVHDAGDLSLPGSTIRVDQGLEPIRAARKRQARASDTSSRSIMAATCT
jgi:hypothetical protein